MLACEEIGRAYLYYAETRRRETVDLSVSLRKAVLDMFTEMHEYYQRRYTPRVKQTKSCNACSLKDACLPRMPQQSQSVSAYLENHLAELESV
jgi:CRISPR-associated exonuclease Cas4